MTIKAKAIRVNARELSTILAALRYWQDALDTNDANVEFDIAMTPEFDIACNGGELQPLDSGEISALCEYIN